MTKIVVSIIYLFVLIEVGFNKTEEKTCFENKIRVKTSEIVNSFKRFLDQVFDSFIMPLFLVIAKKKEKKSKPLLFENDTVKSDQTFGLRGNLPITHAPELIVRHGYRVEIHTVRTKDGYNLTLHRVLPSSQLRTLSRVALLHHGLLGSSDDWLLLGRNKALPYLLSNAGYDVWLANARGNRYSNSFIHEPINKTKFWNFTWHEIGHYDLTATVEYLNKITAVSSQIDYIGYSMGATALLVFLSTLPQYNVLIKSAVLLAPLAYMRSTRGPIRFLAEFIHKHEINALKFLGKEDFMRNASFPEEVINKHCLSADKDLCSNSLLFLVNGGRDIENKTVRRNILEHVPAGGSGKTILHFCQLLNSGRFQMFDYGEQVNMQMYGMKSPPMYQLKKVKIPIAIFSSGQDWMATVSDIVNLISELPYGSMHHIITEKEYSHTDFLWDDDAPKLVYSFILKVLETYGPIRRYYVR